MSEIVSMTVNATTQTIFTTTNCSVQPNKELPKWLLEFGNFPNLNESESNLKSDNNKRPLTESTLRTNKPKWFEELVGQRRRYSEFGTIQMDSNRIIDEKSTILFNDNNQIKSDNRWSNSSSELSPIVNDILELPTQRKLSSELLFPPSITNGNGAMEIMRLNSNESGKSILSSSCKLDDDILSISTSKSIEKLNINNSDQRQLYSIEECIIPEMPYGNELTLNLLENWGDEQWIGFNGIEILDSRGSRPKIKNIFLQDNSNNGSQVSDLRKLVDNVYRTHDDSHIWQHKMTSGRESILPLKIVVQLQESITIALLRIWNYNKSRCHSYRGIKYLQINLNNQLIFSGEIAKASGDLTGSVENFGDTILFTTNEAILEHISKFDTSFQELLLEQIQQQQNTLKL
ncbi:hypothetical protein RDWZM_005199 [Blomia tropicalis]|uniref:KATNIP domain-containing protein n=1 Tax=Blomia tropicalis TaxID=40697 RepID=A0A9Q0M7J2_BLOTA|nr:hypothetical protein RDWZM_005199 [Blomia tropicalis]